MIVTFIRVKSQSVGSHYKANHVIVYIGTIYIYIHKCVCIFPIFHLLFSNFGPLLSSHPFRNVHSQVYPQTSKTVSVQCACRQLASQSRPTVVICSAVREYIHTQITTGLVLWDLLTYYIMCLHQCITALIGLIGAASLCCRCMRLEPWCLSVQLSIINSYHGFPSLPLTWQLYANSSFQLCLVT